MNLYEILRELQIKYEEVEHPPVYTVEEAQLVQGKIEGVGCKNLFLINKKKECFFLVISQHHQALSLLI